MGGPLEELERQHLCLVSQSLFIFVDHVASRPCTVLPKGYTLSDNPFQNLGAVASANGSALAKIGCTVSLFCDILILLETQFSPL